MSKVALVRCDGYGYDQVRKAVFRGLDLVGGAGQFAAPGEKILLKPNLLAADPPEKCTTTHFTVFKAVAEAFLAAGADLSYGDSPGFGSPLNAAKKSGIAGAADELGIPLADFTEGEEVHFPEGRQNKVFTIAKGVLAADGLVSVSKLKTHGLARMTGSIKNQFGCIPGLLKGEFHVKLPDASDFSRMLVDLNLLVRPRLFVMDGIIAMEGKGPRGGTPKPMNVLLFSTDPVALDATVCRMVDVDPSIVPTTVFGKQAGLGTWETGAIDLVGDPFDSFYAPGFDAVREPLKPFRPGNIFGFLQNSLVPRPEIRAEKCGRCGICVKMCPVNPKAVDWHSGPHDVPPTYKYSRCIRCYCCQELCPESAIDLKLPWVRRLFGGK